MSSVPPLSPRSQLEWITLVSRGWKPPRYVTMEIAANRYISSEELSAHSSADDAWMAVRGRVYDVTSYLPVHPGNAKQLMRGAGVL
jgi:cytochrome-b5 reductase